MTPWPAVDYETWSATCDTLHAHTQVLGKLATALAPPEPQLQHAALRLTTRGWETAPLPAPDGSGAFSVLLDLHTYEAVVQHSDGRAQLFHACNAIDVFQFRFALDVETVNALIERVFDFLT